VIYPFNHQVACRFGTLNVFEQDNNNNNTGSNSASVIHNSVHQTNTSSNSDPEKMKVILLNRPAVCKIVGGGVVSVLIL